MLLHGFCRMHLLLFCLGINAPYSMSIIGSTWGSMLVVKLVRCHNRPPGIITEMLVESSDQGLDQGLEF